MSTSTNLRAAIDEIRDGLILSERERKEVVGKFDSEYQRRALERLCQRIGALPWWVVSSGLHAVLFLLVGLLAVATAPTGEKKEVVIIQDVHRNVPTPPIVERRRPSFSSSTEPSTRESDIPLPALAGKPDDGDDAGRDFNEPAPRGTPTDQGDIGEVSLNTGVGRVVGTGDIGGSASAFSIRTDGAGKGKLRSRYGGDGTDPAVELALGWLVRHQEADGRWDCGKYDGSEKTAGDVGVTGLALLAFLGAGHTEKAGRYAATVRRAEEWLMSQQKASGAISCLSSDGRLGYNHAIAGLALAEAYGMGRDPRIGAAAQKAVSYSIDRHQVKYSGWRYAAGEAADTSVTGWFVMQLKSATMAGLSVNGAGFQGAGSFLDSVTSKDGAVGYTKAEGRDACMTSVGMVCRQFMGTDRASPLLAAGSGILSKALPEWNDGRSHSRERGFYYWYYGTLAMFQMGGDAWTQWNARLKTALVDHQCKGGPADGSANDKGGSWDPTSWIDGYGGRVFTTAMGALTLEVYYRYLPMYSK